MAVVSATPSGPGVKVVVATTEGSPDRITARVFNAESPFWSVGAFAATVLIRTVSSITLSRLLDPAAFGIMALATSIAIGAELLSDGGLGQAIVRSPRGDDPVFLNTSWTMQIIRGVVLFAFLCAVAGPVAGAYGVNELVWIIPLAGIGSILAGATSTNYDLLVRHSRQRALALFDLFAHIITTVAVIIVAVATRSIVALAAASVLLHLIRLIVSHTVLDGPRNSLRLERAARTEMLHFGKWVFLATGVMFFNEQIDRILLGGLLSTTVLGVYALSYTIGSLPRELIKSVTSRAVFPVLSKANLESGTPGVGVVLRDMKRRYLPLLAVAVGAISTAMVPAALVMFDDRYAAAAWMAPALACGSWFAVLYWASSTAFLAIGQPANAVWANIAGLVWVLVWLPVLYSWIGVGGAVIAIATSEIPLYVTSQIALRRLGLTTIRVDLRCTIVMLVATVAVAFAGDLVGIDNWLLAIPLSR